MLVAPKAMKATLVILRTMKSDEGTELNYTNMKKITLNISALIIFGLAGTSVATAQVVEQKIGNNPMLINPNAALEIESSNKGLLLPRLTLTATDNAAPLTVHVAGMTVYNTATNGTGVTAVTPGYYYNNGVKWVKIADSADIKTEPWRVVATTNEATANTENIYQNANIGIGDFSAALPTERLDISSGNIRIRDINSVTGTAVDKVIVADATGVLKTVNLNSLNDIKVVETDYTVLDTDRIILGKADLVSNVTIALPVATVANKGKKYTIKKEDADEDGYVNVTGTIIGVPSGTLYTAVPYTGWDFVSDGSAWRIINKF